MNVDNDVEADISVGEHGNSNHVEAPDLQVVDTVDDDTLPSRQSCHCAGSSSLPTAVVRATTATASCQVTLDAFVVNISFLFS